MNLTYEYFFLPIGNATILMNEIDLTESDLNLKKEHLLLIRKNY